MFIEVYTTVRVVVCFYRSVVNCLCGGVYTTVCVVVCVYRSVVNVSVMV